MNSTDYIARQISDVAQVTPQQVANSAQRGLGQVTPTTIQDEGVAFNPYESAINQGRQAIVVNVQAKEAAAKEKEQMTRMAQAVAEAMRPNVEVGHISPEGKVEGVRLDPETIPEPKETIQAGIHAVGVGGRKAVFSEIPFDEEDVPKGWEIIETEDGGYLASPKENADEVVQNEEGGNRHKSLGYVQKKEASHDRVVQVRTPDDTVVQDVSTNFIGQRDAIEQAMDVAGNITDSTIGIVSPQVALEERESKQGMPEAEEAAKPTGGTVFEDIVKMTAHEEHQEGFVSPMTLNDTGGIGRADANRDGKARPYMFHVAGKGWEVDRGYGELIGHGLSKVDAMKLVAKTPAIPLEAAKAKVGEHLRKDVKFLEGKYPRLGDDKISILAMMKYQGVNVWSWTNTNKSLLKAMDSNNPSHWLQVQKNLLNSKWATEQTPDRALRTVHMLFPQTSKESLRALLSGYQNLRRKKKAQTTMKVGKK